MCEFGLYVGRDENSDVIFDLDEHETVDSNYNVVIAGDACGSVAPGLHEFAVENILPRVARVRQTAEIIHALAD